MDPTNFYAHSHPPADVGDGSQNKYTSPQTAPEVSRAPSPNWSIGSDGLEGFFEQEDSPDTVGDPLDLNGELGEIDKPDKPPESHPQQSTANPPPAIGMSYYPIFLQPPVAASQFYQPCPFIGPVQFALNPTPIFIMPYPVHARPKARKVAKKPAPQMQPVATPVLHPPPPILQTPVQPPPVQPPPDLPPLSILPHSFASFLAMSPKDNEMKNTETEIANFLNKENIKPDVRKLILDFIKPTRCSPQILQSHKPHTDPALQPLGADQPPAN